jgi:hypothetical protein
MYFVSPLGLTRIVVVTKQEQATAQSNYETILSILHKQQTV